MKHLIFKIDGQSLVRLDSFKPATDSVEYLTVSFEFPSDWSGTTKTAKFRKDELSYPALISNNVCTVPYEVLVRDSSKGILSKQYFYMSVEGVKGTLKITTDEVKIEIIPSGTGEVTTPNTPTPDVFAQYVEDVKAQTKANSDNAQQSAENAEAFAQSAEESANSLKNDYSNALKGIASGAVVRVDDVSPVEHYPSVYVHGKNLFNGDLIDGILSSESFDSYAMDDYKSLKIYLRKGTYTLSVNNVVYVARTILDGVYTISGIYLNDTVYTFTIDRDGYVGFSMRLDPATEWDDATKIQIEKGETATEYTPYIDPSTVKVIRCGKNLFPVTLGTYNGVTLSKYGDGYVLNGTATGSGLFITKIGQLPGGTYTLSANNPAHNNLGHIFVPLVQVYSPDTLESIAVIDQNTNGVATATIKGGTNYESRIRYQEGITYNNFIVKPQFELNKLTPYEPYTVEKYDVNTDGTVEGIASLAPSMTLLTDTENVTVEVEYNRDINVVIADILAKLS